ncbi:fa6699b5-46ae-45ca-b9f7-97d877b21589 [Thermothielavioides terrestris]|uniref:Fa6699b5-46ae-45ca-b9f7-97d877b21589 n=1 Tax=Thermothielavioides terrestris TaxID=2587410 RepID=A0A446B7B8_9PEZI|nr:fa6699b5-46ae-45ca-b9f7-97d877b21589 [Thermothielavioides terrestris]
MRPVVRDTLSLRPPGFFGYAFLVARLVQIASLTTIIALVSHFIFIITRAHQDNKPPGNLIVVILFTIFALLWTLLSWTGYSRRHLPYAVTWAVDAVFLAPFFALAVVLGLPLRGARCAAVTPASGAFEITAPPGAPPAIGRITVPADGRAACSRLFVVWGLLIVLCVLFAVSAVSVGVLDFGERQLRKAIFAVRKEDTPRSPEMSEAGGAGAATAPAAGPAVALAASLGGGWGAAAPPRPSTGKDRMNFSQPTAAKTPQRRPGERFGLPINPRGS